MSLQDAGALIFLCGVADFRLRRRRLLSGPPGCELERLQARERSRAASGTAGLTSASGADGADGGGGGAATGEIGSCLVAAAAALWGWSSELALWVAAALLLLFCCCCCCGSKLRKRRNSVARFLRPATARVFRLRAAEFREAGWKDF